MVDHAGHLTTRLAHLTAAAAVTSHDLTEELASLGAAVKEAVSSFAGLQLTISIGGHPVTFVLFTSMVGIESVAASVRVPLATRPLTASEVLSQVGTVVRFFAETPGAFVDLAADLTVALGLAPLVTGPGHADEGSRIHLDADLPPSSTTTDVIGLADFDVVNRAAGFLIERGVHPDRADAELARQARAAGVGLVTQARRVLAGPGVDPAGSSDGDG